MRSDRYTCNVTFEAEELAALRRLAEKNGGAYGNVIRWAVVEVEQLRARVAELEGHLNWIGWSSEGIESAEAEVKRLRSIVDKLPKTAAEAAGKEQSNDD